MECSLAQPDPGRWLSLYKKIGNVTQRARQVRLARGAAPRHFPLRLSRKWRSALRINSQVIPLLCALPLYHPFLGEVDRFPSSYTLFSSFHLDRRNLNTMADLHHRDPHHRQSSSSPDTLERGYPDDVGKGGYGEKTGVIAAGHANAVEYEAGHRLHRGLKARHITMIAIGGAIGMLACSRTSRAISVNI